MHRVLIIGDHLLMAGAEKLIYELSLFAIKNNGKVTVLIANNYNIEYYDGLLKSKGIKVARTTLQGTNRLRNPVRILRSLFWRVKLKYFAARSYQSVQVIGLYNADKALDVRHPRRYFWHVNNAVQYPGGKQDLPVRIFQNPGDTIVCINRYQLDELANQYGDIVKCKAILFKLFLTDL